jgi:hypothetical protein
MRLILIPLTLMCCAVAAAAPTGDPLKSPDCLAALALLTAQEAATMPEPPSSDPRQGVQRQPAAGWEAARRDAAQRCLGARLDAPPPPRRAEPAPSRLTPARGLPAAPVRPRSAPATPAVQIPYPRSASFCDATGCLMNDGSRLPRVGENQLVRPEGLCSLQGSVLFCP